MSPSARAAISRALDYQRILRTSGAAGPAAAKVSAGPVHLHEFWSSATIDATNAWATGVAGTGTVGVVTGGSAMRCRLRCPAPLDRAAIASLKTLTNLSLAGSARLYKRLILEWDMLLSGTLAQHDDTYFICGFAESDASAAGATKNRSINNLAGFILSGASALQTLTDKAGTETVTAVAGAPTLIDTVNSFKVMVRSGAIDFYVNGALKNTHSANLPEKPLMPNFVAASKAGAADLSIQLGAIRCWEEDWN